MRAVNLAGRGLRLLGRRDPIDGERVIAAARANTNLRDWGSDRFLEPLEILSRSFERDARLNPLGRYLVRQGLSHFVANRMRIHREIEKDPDLVREPIRRPLFVIGLPRSGTTFLHRLLSAEPDFRSPVTWECYWPAPVHLRGPEGREGRKKQMGRLLRAIDYMAPGLQSIHPLSPEEPEETTLLMANTFVTWTFSLIGAVREYDEWLWSDGEAFADEAYAYLRLQLQILARHPGGSQWVLKSPVHLHGLDALLRAFPDACVVQIHRDPIHSVPSSCSLFAVLRAIGSDHVNPTELGEEVAIRLATALERAMRARERAPERFFDVRYDDLIQDPAAVVRSIDRRFELARDRTAGPAVEAERRSRPPSHHYDLEQFGLTGSRLETLFGEYRAAYGLDSGPSGRPVAVPGN